MSTIKSVLLEEASHSKNAKVDRSEWKVCVAKKDITHRGVTHAKKGESLLYDPNSLWKYEGGRLNITVYLARNMGGVNTGRYASEFELS